MAFVKLDCGLLDSSLWVDVPACRVFTTALLMAMPREFLQPMPQLAVRSLDPTGFVVPAGWFGFVAAAGVGITRPAEGERAGVGDGNRLAVQMTAPPRAKNRRP